MSSKGEDNYKRIVTPFLIFIWGGGIINTTGNLEKSYLDQVLEWLNKQKSEAIKTAIEKWPDDYKFIAESACWFEQITDAIVANPPKDNVKRVVVIENQIGDVVSADYIYYPKDDQNIGKIAFRITTQGNQNN